MHDPESQDIHLLSEQGTHSEFDDIQLDKLTLQLSWH
jgi:hypothetical protein